MCRNQTWRSQSCWCWSHNCQLLASVVAAVPSSFHWLRRHLLSSLTKSSDQPRSSSSSLVSSHQLSSDRDQDDDHDPRVELWVSRWRASTRSVWKRKCDLMETLCRQFKNASTQAIPNSAAYCFCAACITRLVLIVPLNEIGKISLTVFRRSPESVSPIVR